MTDPKVFLAYPYSGTARVDATLAAFHTASRLRDRLVFFPSNGPPGSHCENFNRLWCMMLNSRERDGWTHFAMIHSDVEPEPGWLDDLLDEMNRVDADVLSVILPIKDGRGLTSTTVRNRKTMHNRRITMRQLKNLPATFDAAALAKHDPENFGEDDDLLISSGLWIARVGDWMEQVWFEMRDRIARLPDGRFVAFNWSEDWNFSAQCHEWGLRLFSTHKIKAFHVGPYDYCNQVYKGAWLIDEDASYGEWLRDLPGLRSREDGCNGRLPEAAECPAGS